MMFLFFSYLHFLLIHFPLSWLVFYVNDALLCALRCLGVCWYLNGFYPARVEQEVMAKIIDEMHPAQKESVPNISSSDNEESEVVSPGTGK